MAGSRAAVSVSAGSAWAVSECAGKTGHLYNIGRTLGDNNGASWQNMTGAMAWQRIGADSWASSMFFLTLVIGLDVVGPNVGP